MWTLILKIASIVFAVYSFIKRLKKGNRTRERIEADKRLADAIRRGDGKKVAEEWKRRKYYS